MSKELICLSPIDGTVYATRKASSLEAAQEKIAIMRHAQIKWANRTLDERITLVLSGVEILGEHARGNSAGTGLDDGQACSLWW
jgi:acyl-CoA reductase-like NAD-dependent aldehyde dehydrogenase